MAEEWKLPDPDSYDGKAMKGGMKGVTPEMRIKCVKKLHECMEKYPEMDFNGSPMSDANLGWLTVIADRVLKESLPPNSDDGWGDYLVFHLNDALPWIVSSNANDTIYGPTEGRGTPHHFFKRRGYKSAIKAAHMSMALVKFDPLLDMDSIQEEITTERKITEYDKKDRERLEVAAATVGAEYRLKGENFLEELGIPLTWGREKGAKLKAIEKAHSLVQSLADGERGEISKEKWANETYRNRYIIKAKSILHLCESASEIDQLENGNSKIKADEKAREDFYIKKDLAKAKSEGEQQLVAHLDVCDGLKFLLRGEEVVFEDPVAIVSNLKGYLNMIVGTPLEIDEVYYSILKENEVTYVIPMEVKGIGEHLNKSKIWQQYQAFRINIPVEYEVRMLALTESEPPEGWWKRLDLIEFKLNDDFLVSNDPDSRIMAIKAVEVKQHIKFLMADPSSITMSSISAYD